ncbi:uncharacterized protein LOC116129841 [Pistacia vera]|uniref:uncharacterized protein LOC116129841 n=1 Tax=Pistacia vera TaxID=55513 RepID=UPI001262AE60|nr:uncharacterized protein LOC116129841 [Pistacia vera]
MTCGLKVDTSDPGWYKSMTKILRKIKGASYNINVEEGMAYITGKANPSKLLKKLRSEKYADLCWVMTGNRITYGNGSAYCQPMEPPSSYWHNHHPVPLHHHNFYPQRPPMVPYSYHDFQNYGYWDRISY